MCGVGQKPSWHFATCHYEITSDGSGWWTVCWSNAWSLTHHTKVKCYGACLACKRATWFITLLPLHWQAKTYTVDWALKAKCWTTQLIFNSSMLHRTTAVCFGQKSTQHLCSFFFSLSFHFFNLFFNTNHVLILHHVFKAWVGGGGGGGWLAGGRVRGGKRGQRNYFRHTEITEAQKELTIQTTVAQIRGPSHQHTRYTANIQNHWSMSPPTGGE